MIRLGGRLAVAGGAASLASIALAALAVGLGTAVLLFAASFPGAYAERADRAAWRDPSKAVVGDDSHGIWLVARDDRFGTTPIVRILVAKAGDPAPVPPGLPRIPAPGESFVSPALNRLIGEHPSQELGARFGRVVGEIGESGLRSPDELVAVVGVDPALLRAGGVSPFASLRTVPVDPVLPPVAILLIVLAVVGALVPVGVFVSTATRLGAARREQRLAALMLVGATPRQIAAFAAIEALIVTAIGAVAGIGFFLLLRPAVATIALDGVTWFPDSIVPPLPAAIALIAAAQVVGVGAAVLSLRRLVVSPLGVRARTNPAGVSAIRLVPIVLGVVVLLGTLVALREGGYSQTLPLVLIAASFGAIIVGIAAAGPWLTAVVGSLLFRVARGPASLVAARRLEDDPRSSFGAVAGVVMAVFVAAAFATVSGYAESAAGTGLAPGTVGASLAAATTASAALEADLRGVPGVQTVVAARPVTFSFGDAMVLSGWIAPCRDVARLLGAEPSRCDGSGVYLTGSDAPPLEHSYTITPASGGPDSGSAPVSATISIPNLSAVPVLGRPRPGSPLGRDYYVPEMVVDPAALPDASLFPADIVFVVTNGSEQSIERARTAITAAYPTAYVQSPEDRADGLGVFVELARVVGLGLLATLVLAGCSLSVATTTALLERRRQFALLRAAGMPVARVRALVLLQAGTPLVVVSLFSAALGVVVAQAVLRLVAGHIGVPLPDWSLVVTLAASLAAAMAVVVVTLPLVERLTRFDSLRHE